MSSRPVAELLSIDEFCARYEIDRPRFWQLVGEDVIPAPIRVERHDTLRIRVFDHAGER
jgi:hypothetical protein